MTYGARPIGTRGYGDSTRDVPAPGVAGTLGPVAGTDAWAWSTPSAPLSTAMMVVGTDAWAWSAGNASVVAAMQVSGSGLWAWNSNGYLVIPPPTPYGSGSGFTPIPVVAGLPNLNVRLKPIQRVSPAMPNALGTLGPTGRPNRDTFVPVITRADWGFLQLVIDGVDVTFLRSVPATIDSWESAEPFSDLSMVVTFPQVAYFQPRGASDLSWCHDFAESKLWHINPDGSRDTDPLWEGMISSYRYKTGGLEVTFLGALHQAGFYVRAPGLDDTAVDIGTLIAFNMANNTGRPAERFNNMPVTMTGVMTKYRGKWETVLEFINKLLQQLSDPTTGKQYTVAKRYPVTPILTIKDLTTVKWSVTPGTPGVEVDLQQELTTNPNTFYGEGIDVARARWSNSYLDGGGFVHYIPLAADSAVEGTIVDSHGRILATGGTIDTTKIRHEVYQSYGQGVSLLEAKQSAGVQLASFEAGPGWVGTINLSIDPEEDSRLRIRAGDNIRVRYFDGGPYAGQIFHIAHVKIDHGQGPSKVTLTVDTKARDIQTVAAIIERNRDMANRPVQRLIAGKDSALSYDTTILWDAAAGSGVIPTDRFFDGSSTVSCPGGQWTFGKIRASEADKIARTEIDLSVATPFHISFYTSQPKSAQFSGKDPFAKGAWDNKDVPLPSYYIIGWGSYQQRAGFYPGLESNSDPATGVLLDEAEWSFTHDSLLLSERGPGSLPFLWFAIYPVATCTMRGTLSRGIGSYT